MKIKSVIPPTLVISAVLGLNAIATAIDYPEVCEQQSLAEPVTVAEIESEDYIDKTAKQYGLEPKIVKAIIEEESRWYASAEGDNGQSIGLMQIQPRWHKERLTRLGVTNLYDPKQNVTVGCDILSDLYDKYGNYEDALSVYNSGNTEDGREYAERILRK